MEKISFTKQNNTFECKTFVLQSKTQLFNRKALFYFTKHCFLMEKFSFTKQNTLLYTF